MSIVGSLDERSAPFAIELVVRELAPVVSFYQRVGFQLVRQVPRFVVLRWDAFYLLVAEDPAAIARPRWTNLRIIVPDVDQVWERVNDAGVAVVNAIGDRPFGLRDFTIRDPAGFEIRFAQVI